jgi:hypothetical protein
MMSIQASARVTCYYYPNSMLFIWVPCLLSMKTVLQL